MATGGICAVVCTLTNLNVRGSGLTVMTEVSLSRAELSRWSAGGAEGWGAEGKTE